MTNGIKTSLAAFAAFIALATTPAAASANDYCVGISPNCSVGAYSFDSAGLQGALNAAAGNAGADRVIIASGTLPITTNVTTTTSDQLDVVDSGPDATLLQRNGGTGSALTLNVTAAGTISALKLEQTGSTASNPYLLSLDSGKATNIEVVDSGTSSLSLVALASNATLDTSKLTVNSSGDTAVSATSGSATVKQSLLASVPPSFAYATNLSGNGSTYNISRTTFKGFGRGVSLDSGGLLVTDSLFDLGTYASATGIYALNDNTSTSPIQIDVRRTSIVGSGTSQRAMRLGANSTSETFTGQVVDTLLRTTGTGGSDISCASGATVAPTLQTDHTAFDSTRVAPASCTVTHTNQVDTNVVTPLFRDAAGGDYRPVYNSPLVDAGTSGGILGADPLDLSGGNRLVDGNGNGVAAVDVGAYEYQRSAPTITTTASNSTPFLGETVTLGATASDAEGETITLARAFDDGGTGTGATVAHAFASGGAHTATVTATDTAGAASTAVVALNVIGYTADTPSLRVVQKPTKSFRRANKVFAIKPGARQPYFGLRSAGAKAFELTLERKASGVRRSGKCRAGRGKPRCTRYVKLKGSRTFTAPDGELRLTFGGRHAGKLLPVGSYRMTLVPSGGFTAGKPVRATFSLR